MTDSAGKTRLFHSTIIVLLALAMIWGFKSWLFSEVSVRDVHASLVPERQVALDERAAIEKNGSLRDSRRIMEEKYSGRLDRVVVIDDSTGLPLPGVDVCSFEPGRVRVAPRKVLLRTEKSGTFDPHGLILPVVLEHSSFLPFLLQPRRMDGSPVRMKRSMVARVRVVTAAGAAVPHVDVALSQAPMPFPRAPKGRSGVGRSAIHCGRTDSNGVASIAGLEMGNYFCRAFSDEYLPVVLKKGMRQPHVPGGEITIRVLTIYGLAVRFKGLKSDRILWAGITSSSGVVGQATEYRAIREGRRRLRLKVPDAQRYFVRIPPPKVIAHNDYLEGTLWILGSVRGWMSATVVCKPISRVRLEYVDFLNAKASTRMGSVELALGWPEKSVPRGVHVAARATTWRGENDLVSIPLELGKETPLPSGKTYRLLSEDPWLDYLLRQTPVFQVAPAKTAHVKSEISIPLAPVTIRVWNHGLKVNRGFVQFRSAENRIVGGRHCPDFATRRWWLPTSGRVRVSVRVPFLGTKSLLIDMTSIKDGVIELDLD